MKPLKIYFSGSLFNHKDLIGNYLLANTISQQSNGQYECLLPQDIECDSTMRGHEIRNNNFNLLKSCELGLFHFDGSELDSGTVIEFVKARELDMPAVIVRTDFRRSGDNDDYPWNLMAAYYPRTETVILHAMQLYNEAKDVANRFDVNRYCVLLAAPILQALDKVKRTEPLQKPVLSAFHRSWAFQSIGMNVLQGFDENAVP